MIGGCDVFFSPHFTSAPVSAGCRKVITFHDLSFERYPEFFDLKRKFWHFSNKPKKRAEEADHIIAVSQSTAYDIQDVYGIDSQKITAIYSGISERFFEEQTREELWHIQSKYKLPDRFILSLSTIEPRKNVLGAIRAFELFKDSTCAERNTARANDVRLVIAGNQGWLYKDVFEGIKKSKWRRDIL
jgi:glycosyltransferase involved in cell wall biosynthesis